MSVAQPLMCTALALMSAAQSLMVLAQAVCFAAQALISVARALMGGRKRGASQAVIIFYIFDQLVCTGVQ